MQAIDQTSVLLSHDKPKMTSGALYYLVLIIDE